MRAPMAAFLAVLVSGCTTIDPPAAKLQAIQTVGIVSALGDEFTLTKTGLTGLGDDDQRFSIEPWGIDDLIVTRAGALLGRRFQVQPVTYRRASFGARDRASPIVAVNLLRDDPVKELVRSQVSPQGLDAYVVITKATAPYGSRGRTVAGVGLINHNAVFGSYAQLHALYAIRVIDGHEFKVIDKKVRIAAGRRRDGPAARSEPPSRGVPPACGCQ
jgi:hypothetical protein